MNRKDIRLVLADMQSADPRAAKGGVQSACELLESSTVPTRTRSSISRALSVQLASNDTHVRRWTYKLIALLRDPTYVPYLERQLAHGDMVPENRTWAVAALAALDPDYLKTLYDVGEELTTEYALAAGMYRDTELTMPAVRAATRADNPLAHQWLGLLYGENRIDLDHILLHELTSSPSPEVVEYAIWGLRLRREHGIETVNLDPLSLMQQQVNIRRWYYRTVAQDPKARDVYAAQVIEWIERDADSKAREGLARGLHESPKDRFWRGVQAQWRREEHDPFVLRALGVPISTMNLTLLIDPSTGINLSVGRSLTLEVLPRLEPDPVDRRHPREGQSIMIYYNNSVSVTNNGTVGQVLGAYGTMNTGSLTTSGSTTADIATLLTALAEHLRTLSDESTHDGTLEEIDELIAEEAAIEEATAEANNGTDLEPRRRHLGARLAALAATIRGAGATTAATTELIEQIEHLAHTILN